MTNQLRPVFVAVVCALLTFPVFAAEPPGYYDPATGLSSAELKSALHEIIDDHTRFPYTSTATDTWDIIHDADQDEANPANVLDVYRNHSFAKTDHWSSSNTAGWNREHSWPKSYGFSQDGTCNYPYTDVHHLFASDGGYNSARSNIPYEWAPGGTAYPVDNLGFSNWRLGSYSAGSWEVWEYRKGDVARAAFYMAVRYEGGTHGLSGCSEPDLILTSTRSLIESNSSSNLSVAYMGILSTLLEWHLQDPVDERERRRNDVVYGYQGNRNPFIDHPEWVSEIWGGGTPGNQIPIANFSYSCTDLSCTFTDLSSDSDGTITNWSWDFGDGTISSTQNPVHNYASATSYTVILQVTDEGGATDSVTQTVSIDAPPSEGAVDISNWKLSQQNFTYDYIFPAKTFIDENGYVVVARNSTQSAFESHWSRTLGPDVTFLNSGNGMPVINGDEVYTLYDASGSVVDGTTISIQSGQSVQRADLCGAAGSASSWSIGADSSSTAGSGAPAGCGAGIRISEFSDASGSGNYVYEYVELYFDVGGSADTTPPSAPSGLTASAGDGQVTLDWSDNGESDFASYDVLRSTSSGGSYSPVATAITPSNWNDTTVTNGTTYFYVVTASDTSGNVSSNSAEVAATPTAATTNTPPSAGFSYSCTDLDCSFTDLSFDSDGAIVGWSWDFGDGSGSSAGSPMHSYGSAGTYSVLLVVTDNEGATDQITYDVSVSSAPAPISLFANGYKIKGRQHVDLSWSRATSADVDVVRDGVVIATTANDGAYTDAIGNKGGASYIYEVCESGSQVCSSSITVTF